MAFSFPRTLIKTVFSLLLLVFIVSSFTSASSSSSSSPPPAGSPSAETELICHTENPAECYPKVFSATDEFQVVHDDQDLPPGLHVQLDVQTGKKQAKLYDPTEENPALEGLPVDQAVIVVDPEQQLAVDDEPRIPPGAPAYEPIGIVKEPREKNEGFDEALAVVKEYPVLLPDTDWRQQHDDDDVVPENVSRALDTLEELSHDMYYGLRIAEDADALAALSCLAARRDDDDDDAAQALTDRPDFLASTILASAVRNNAPALRAAEGLWDAVAARPCRFTPRTLRDELYHGPEPGSLEGADDARLRLAVLGALLRSPKISGEFIEAGGMRGLLRVLLREGEAAWEPRRAKAAQIVSDTFLDEDVGATLGVWPTGGRTDPAICAEGGPESLGDGCWEYHLAKISSDPESASWSWPLLELLERRRPVTTSQPEIPPPEQKGL
ncbi:hypothetical protein F4809DRAFT_438955 [Biscogniauxia mediterranea]|nr:hypothetical protein F4809DRAFT_438955 [Biscogniauxia mediterranea]